MLSYLYIYESHSLCEGGSEGEAAGWGGWDQGCRVTVTQLYFFRKHLQDFPYLQEVPLSLVFLENPRKTFTKVI